MKVVWTKMIKLLIAAPRTVPELYRLLKSTPRYISRLLYAMADEGLVKRYPGLKVPRGRPALIWKWNV